MSVESSENIYNRRERTRSSKLCGLDHYRIPTNQRFPEHFEKPQDFTAGKV